MTKKLIAIDLDGTTLNSHSLISPRTASVLKKATAAGHYVSIATGRPYRMSAQFYQQLQLETPMVTFNGALVHKPNMVWPYERELSIQKEIAFEIIAQKEKLQLEFVAAENRETFFIDRLDNFEGEFFATEKITEANLFKNLTSNPTSLLVKTQKEVSSLVSASLISQFKDSVDVRTWGGPSPTLEIVSLGIQKAMGIERIAQSYNIAQEDIIAFGDEANDYEMIQYAGLGVVMNNGIEALQNIADDVTTYSNHENGLAEYLTNYFEL